jgi:hypothetical protein
MKFPVTLTIGVILLSICLIHIEKVKAATTDGDIYQQIKTATFFKFLVPNTEKWNMEVKSPYPLNTTKPITKVRFHYFDKKDRNHYMFGISEENAEDMTRQNIIVDPNTKKVTYGIVKYKPICLNEKIKINGNNSCFSSWADGSTGGHLWWIQEGTYIEMESAGITKEDMIRIAKSMR